MNIFNKLLNISRNEAQNEEGRKIIIKRNLGKVRYFGVMDLNYFEVFSWIKLCCVQNNLSIIFSCQESTQLVEFNNYCRTFLFVITKSHTRVFMC